MEDVCGMMVAAQGPAGCYNKAGSSDPTARLPGYQHHHSLSQSQSLTIGGHLPLPVAHVPNNSVLDVRQVAAFARMQVGSESSGESSTFSTWLGSRWVAD